MHEIYDNYIEHSIGLDGTEQDKRVRFTNNYRHLMPADRDARVVDVGIGRGEMLSLYRDWGYRRAEGIDISRSAIAHCQAAGLACTLVADSAEWFRAQDRAIDLVSMLDVLEHVERAHVIPLLAAVHGALRPGGILIVQVPNMQSPDHQLNHYDDFTHVAGFTEKSLAQVARAAGFDAITFRPFEQFGWFGARRLRSWVDLGRRIARPLLFAGTRLSRGLTGAPNPAILTPVLVAILRRDEDAP